MVQQALALKSKSNNYKIWIFFNCSKPLNFKKILRPGSGAIFLKADLGSESTYNGDPENGLEPTIYELKLDISKHT